MNGHIIKSERESVDHQTWIGLIAPTVPVIDTVSADIDCVFCVSITSSDGIHNDVLENRRSMDRVRNRLIGTGMIAH